MGYVMIVNYTTNKSEPTNWNISQVYAVNGIITPSCNEKLDEELRKMWVAAIW